MSLVRRLLAAALAIFSLYAVMPAAAAVPRSDKPLDGFVVGYLPPGVGERESDFAYEWEDVGFHSRVWESGPDAEGGYRVDLSVLTLRGASLTDLDAVRVFLTDYLERDRQTWPLRRVKVGSYDAYRDGERVFWFVAQGVAASVAIDRERLSGADLMRTARGFRPADGTAAEPPAPRLARRGPAWVR